MQDVHQNITNMKGKIIVIACCGLLGWLVASIHETHPQEKSILWIYVLLFVLIVLNPLLRYTFPMLKKMEIGTLNFYPNVIKYIIGKKKF